MIWRDVVQAYQLKPRRGLGRVTYIAVGGGAHDLRVGGEAQDLEGDGSKILVDEIALQELAVDRGAAFAQQRADAVLLAEQTDGEGEIDARSFSRAPLGMTAREKTERRGDNKDSNSQNEKKPQVSRNFFGSAYRARGKT